MEAGVCKGESAKPLTKSLHPADARFYQGDIDISDMPPAPPRDAGASDPSPHEAKYLAAPMPENHRERQLAFNRLDYEGKRGGIKPSEIAVPAGEEPLPDSLEGHPA